MAQVLENISLDGHFARFLAGLVANDGVDLYLAALLTSLATRTGDICIHLEEWAGQRFQLRDGTSVTTPALEEWLRKLRRSPVVGIADGAFPLVLDDERLYLSRYWEYEEAVAAFLRQRGAAADCPFDCEAVVAGVDRIFPPRQQDGAGPDWQRLAGLAVILRSFVVITGGPGTGKTTTVALVLALLGELCRLRGGRLRVALAAPTGKAAMRLQETVAGLKSAGRLPHAATDLIPDQVMTLHRLLGVIDGSPDFRHHQANPLAYDLLVVDEASMVDLPLMAKLFAAVPATTRLILLGDRHQLASVEPGAVLGDICYPSALGTFSPAFRHSAHELGEEVGARDGTVGPERLCDSLIELRQSRRFGSGSGIARLGRAIQDGDFAGVWDCLQDPAYPEVVWRQVDSPRQLQEWLVEQVAGGAFDWLHGRRPEQILEAGERFRVLCAMRQGSFGAEEVSRRLLGLLVALEAKGSPDLGPQGRPIMVLSNDYDLQLYNGDTGVLWPAEAGTSAVRAYFPGPDGSLRVIAPSRLPKHEVSYAMTVHKSQGSEFSRVALVLPGKFAPVLSRELLFTAVTRARQGVTICGTPEVLAQAVATVTERRSGLRRKLWG